MRWLKHAFAIEPEGPATPTDEQRAIVDRVLRAVVRRRMTTPARLALEVGRPLNHITAQAMHFFAPLVTTVAGGEGYERFVAFIEHRGSVDYLCRRLDELESARTTPERPDAPVDGQCPTENGPEATR